MLTQSTIFQSCRDGAIASWVINQYFRGVKCLAQGHNTAAVGFEPRTSRSGVRHSTTEPPRSPSRIGTITVTSVHHYFNEFIWVIYRWVWTKIKKKNTCRALEVHITAKTLLNNCAYTWGFLPCCTTVITFKFWPFCIAVSFVVSDLCGAL